MYSRGRAVAFHIRMEPTMARTDTEKPFAIFTIDSDRSFDLGSWSIHARIVRGKIRYTIWEQPVIRRPHAEKAVDDSCESGSI